MTKQVERVATREGFARAVLECAGRDAQIVLLGLDVTGSLGLTSFAERYPEQYISLGIAEQNGAGVAAGLALNGLKPIFSTYATFATTRALDQIRVSICYNEAPVLIVGAHAGISVGPDGATHQALEDMATMRVLPGMRVLSPCDANETYWMVRALLETPLQEPVYVRVGRAAVPNFTQDQPGMNPYHGVLLREGRDVVLVATGHMVWHALEAADGLAKEGIECSVLNMRSVKPLHTELLLEHVQGAQRALVVTVEEHQCIGGLGSAVCECICEQLNPVRVVRCGIKDRFGESGAPDKLLERFSLTSADIVHTVREALNEGARCRD